MKTLLLQPEAWQDSRQIADGQIVDLCIVIGIFMFLNRSIVIAVLFFSVVIHTYGGLFASARLNPSCYAGKDAEVALKKEHPGTAPAERAEEQFAAVAHHLRHRLPADEAKDEAAFFSLTELQVSTELSPLLRLRAQLLRAIMRLQNWVGDKLLTEAEAFNLFTEIKDIREWPLSPEDTRVLHIMQVQAQFTRALMRVNRRVDDTFLSLDEAFSIFTAVALVGNSPQMQAEAGSLRAKMRFDRQVPDQLLTDEETFRLLRSLENNPGLSPAAQAQTQFMRVAMRFQHRVTDELLTDQETVSLLQNLIRYSNLTAGLQMECRFMLANMLLTHRADRRDCKAKRAFRLFHRVLNSGDAQPAIRAEATYLAALMRYQNRVGDDLLDQAECMALFSDVAADENAEPAIRGLARFAAHRGWPAP
jgi:hypothetical protein